MAVGDDDGPWARTSSPCGARRRRAAQACRRRNSPLGRSRRACRSVRRASRPGRRRRTPRCRGPGGIEAKSLCPPSWREVAGPPSPASPASRSGDRRLGAVGLEPPDPSLVRYVEEAAGAEVQEHRVGESGADQCLATCAERDLVEPGPAMSGTRGRRGPRRARAEVARSWAGALDVAPEEPDRPSACTNAHALLPACRNTMRAL